VRREPDAERFVGEDFDGLVARIQRRFRGGVSAEDAVQEALIRAWQRSVSGEDIESWNGWVATVANNLARSAWRRREAEARAMARYRRWPRQPGLRRGLTISNGARLSYVRLSRGASSCNG
jgi:DNA-directed RNA polymerase specialized sigma24 family protein